MSVTGATSGPLSPEAEAIRSTYDTLVSVTEEATAAALTVGPVSRAEARALYDALTVAILRAQELAPRLLMLAGGVVRVDR